MKSNVPAARPWAFLSWLQQRQRQRQGQSRSRLLPTCRELCTLLSTIPQLLTWPTVMPAEWRSALGILGAAAVAFITNNVTGYMAAINGTKGPTSSWKVFGIPLTAMLETKGSSVAVLKSPVDLSGEPYRKFQAERASWIQGDMYENPGPVQFHGPSADSTTKTLALQNFSYLDEIEEVQESIKTITDALLPGCDGVTLSIAHKSLNALASSIRLMKN